MYISLFPNSCPTVTFNFVEIVSTSAVEVSTDAFCFTPSKKKNRTVPQATEIAENAPAAHIHIIADDGIANVAEVRHKDLTAQQAALHLHRIADNTVIAYGGFAAQVGIRADAAASAYAHMPLDDSTGQHH